MKKYLFAALALTAMVACSKDDVPTDDVLTSSKKSVTISIANMASGTRADFTGGSTTQGTQTAVTAIDNKFHILFLDAGNKIQLVYTADDGLAQFGSAGSYTFHSLPDYITKVAAVGNLTTAPDVNDVFDDLINEWKTESAATVAAEFNTLIAYAEAVPLTRTNNDTCTDPHGDTYPLYKATIEVNPIMARIEVTSISCTAFGDVNVGYDAIGVTSMELAGGTNSYSRTLGSFADDATLMDGDTSDWVLKPVPVGDPAQTLTAGTGKVWSWNILPQAKSNLVTSLYVSGNGYTTVAPERTVTITSYTDTNTSNLITNFEAGKIYRFAIPFSHTNLDPANGIICANVTVHIADWVVVDTGVGFATIP